MLGDTLLDFEWETGLKVGDRERGGTLGLQEVPATHLTVDGALQVTALVTHSKWRAPRADICL